jgi:hypothetical protein
MPNPFAELNSKIRDADDKFTKREYIAALLLSQILNENAVSYSAQIERVAKVTDELLEYLRHSAAKR